MWAPGNVQAPGCDSHNNAMMIMIITILVIERFLAHDEVGRCRRSLVSPEQPVLCIPDNSYTENIKVRFCPCIKQMHTYGSKQCHVLADTATNGTAYAAETPQPGHSFGRVL